MPRPRKRKRKSLRQPSSNRAVVKKFNVADPQIRMRWNYKKTINQNYRDMGLMINPNSKAKIKVQDPIDLKVPEAAPPTRKRLSNLEIKYCERLIRKYGDDYRAMSRDIKLNNYQFTPSQLAKKCNTFWALHAPRAMKLQRNKFKKNSNQQNNEKNNEKNNSDDNKVKNVNDTEIKVQNG